MLEINQRVRVTVAQSTYLGRIVQHTPPNPHGEAYTVELDNPSHQGATHVQIRPWHLNERFWLENANG